mgnify:CR=1 FL=1
MNLPKQYGKNEQFGMGESLVHHFLGNRRPIFFTSLQARNITGNGNAPWGHEHVACSVRENISAGSKSVDAIYGDCLCRKNAYFRNLYRSGANATHNRIQTFYRKFYSVFRRITSIRSHPFTSDTWYGRIRSLKRN